MAACLSLLMGPSILVAQESTGSSGPESLRPTRVLLEPMPDLDGPRHLVAGQDGEVYLVWVRHGVSYAISAEGQLELAVELGRPVPGASAAAVSKRGDWVFLSALSGELSLFRGGQQKPIPAPSWLPVAIAFAGNSLLVSEAPYRRSESATELSPGVEIKPPSRIARLGGSGWSEVVPWERQELEAMEASRSGLPGWQSWIVADSEGRMVHMRRSAYDLEVYEKTGKRMARVTDEQGATRFMSDEAAAEAEEAMRVPPPKRDESGKVSQRRPRVQRFVEALAWTPNGTLLVLHRGVEGRLLLDRIDLAQLTASRAEVLMPRGIEKPLRMVPGSEALFLVSAVPSNEALVLDWPTIESYEGWQEVFLSFD